MAISLLNDAMASKLRACLSLIGIAEAKRPQKARERIENFILAEDSREFDGSGLGSEGESLSRS